MPLPKFTDEDLEAITCDSTWRRGRSELVSSSCQTHELKCYDVSVMSKDTEDVECQTDKDNAKMLAGTYNDDFTECLQKAAKRMLRELSKPQSKAFDNYHPIWDDDDESTVSCLLTMNDKGSEKHTDMPVTGLVWNATGSVLAASFGHTDHDDWCNHKSRVCMWNIDRHDKIAKVPDQFLDVDGCSTCLSFHPTQPGLLVSGTFSGDIVVWDIAKDTESNVLISDSQQESHGDPVCRVYWTTETRGKNNIISISSSGRITLWTLTQKGTKIEVSKSNLIDAPHNFKLRLKSKSIAASTVAIDPVDSGTFLLGTETGGVFKCARNTDSVSANLAFRAHNGPVYGIDYSPFMRNVFASSGTDCCVNIYSILQENPLVTLEPCQGYLYSCKWSPNSASIIALAGSRGNVVFYNLDVSHSQPFYVLECNEKHVPIQAVEFNHKHRTLLATGDAKGAVKVWTLGSDLNRAGENDMPAIIGEMMGKDG